LPKNVYFVGYDDDDNFIKEEYKGNGDITVGGISAGKIQNGQVSLSFPDDVVSKYLWDKETFCSKIGDIECNVSFIPKNLTFIWVGDGSLIVTIPDKSGCKIDIVLVYEGGRYKKEIVDGGFIYSSQSGKITGESCIIRFEDGVCSTYLNYDLNLSKGWNIFYVDDQSYNMTTNRSSLRDKTGGKLEWRIKCND
jgi:hypothetical protein